MKENERTDSPANDDVPIVKHLHASFTRADRPERGKILVLECNFLLLRIEAQDQPPCGRSSRCELVRAVREDGEEDGGGEARGVETGMVLEVEESSASEETGMSSVER
jgi:hypothetical protein